MKRTDARRVAEKISNQEIKEMLDNAKNKISDWRKQSKSNKNFTIGTAWNILTKNFNLEKDIHILAKTNMVYEFSEYLPEYLKIKKEIFQKPDKELIHQDPIFNYEDYHSIL